MQLQHLHAGRAVAFSAEKPARAFGNAETKHSVKKRRKRGHPQHPAPGIRAGASQQGIGHISDQNSKNNVELEHPGESPAILRRSNFRDVQGSDDGGNADAQAADDARNNKDRNIGRQPDPTAPAK